MTSTAYRGVFALLVLLQLKSAASLTGYNYQQPIRTFQDPYHPYNTFSTAPQIKSNIPAPLPTFKPLTFPSAAAARPVAHALPALAPFKNVVSHYTAPASTTFHHSTHINHSPAAAAIVQHPIHVADVHSHIGSHLAPIHHNDYVLNGRHLHQYAVTEIIQNDIEIPEEFVGPNSLDLTHHIHHGLGAISGRSSFDDFGRKSFQQQRSKVSPITIGSGSLGYIRLPNGGVYLGSGSLGYISGQQRSDDILAARQRIGSGPDALHFGKKK